MDSKQLAAEHKRLRRAIEDEEERIAEPLAALDKERDALLEEMEPFHERERALSAKYKELKAQVHKLRLERVALIEAQDKEQA